MVHRADTKNGPSEKLQQQLSENTALNLNWAVLAVFWVHDVLLQEKHTALVNTKHHRPSESTTLHLCPFSTPSLNHLFGHHSPGKTDVNPPARLPDPSK